MIEKKKILVVEDDGFLNDMLTDHLRNSGFEITPSKDAEEALLKLEGPLPSVVLLDLRLPGMDGFQFLEKLREKKLAPEKFPVIVLTNLSEEESIAKCKALGAVEYIDKSHYGLDDITEKIRSVLGMASTE